MVRVTPLLAVLFLVTALSLAGIPPLSGFISKFSLLDAGIAVEQYPIIAVSLVVSLLTLFSMIRIWNGVFWSPPEREAIAVTEGSVPSGGGPRLMVLPTVALVVGSLLVALAAGPIYDFSLRTAEGLLDRDAYIDEVLTP
jgi:multicomponent Na+:H+ antiporter subunit D